MDRVNRSRCRCPIACQTACQTACGPEIGDGQPIGKGMEGEEGEEDEEDEEGEEGDVEEVEGERTDLWLILKSHTTRPAEPTDCNTEVMESNMIW